MQKKQTAHCTESKDSAQTMQSAGNTGTVCISLYHRYPLLPNCPVWYCIWLCHRNPFSYHGGTKLPCYEMLPMIMMQLMMMLMLLMIMMLVLMLLIYIMLMQLLWVPEICWTFSCCICFLKYTEVYIFLEIYQLGGNCQCSVDSHLYQELAITAASCEEEGKILSAC